MAGGEGVKIVVTGNCQARPLASLLGSLPDIEVLDVIVLHLSNENQASAHQEKMFAADIIIAQQTIDSFLPCHLSSNQIRSIGKSIIWPNIFFAGQQPFLNYVTSPSKGRLLGPLDVYHDIRILELWHRDRCGTVLFDEELDGQCAVRIAERSLQELERREQLCDVVVTDMIKVEWEVERLFFTFNHPSNRLLLHVATQIVERMGLPSPVFEVPVSEPLAKITPPSIMDLENDGSQLIYRGVEGVGGAVARTYSWNTFVDAAFAAYDAQREMIMKRDFRLTPNYTT